MTKSIIAAVGREREIGASNAILWNLPEDRKKFRETTTGHSVIMGRKTYESIISFLGKPLPNRTNIVITRNTDFKAPGCIIVHSMEEALATTNSDGEVFIIGGGAIYEQTLPYVDRLYLTQIDESYPNADVFFPRINFSDWQIVQKKPLPTPESGPTAPFVVYERKKRESES